MKNYKALIALSITVNILASTIYWGVPGLQYIITPLFILLSSFFILWAMYYVRKSKIIIKITLIILLVNILAGLPIYLQNILISGSNMRITGLICYGIGIPIEIILFIIASKKHITNHG